MSKNRKTMLPTSGGIGRIARVLISEVGEDAAREIMEDANRFRSMTKKNRAEYIRHLIRRMKEVIGVPRTYSILLSCGQKCCSANTRNKALELFRKSKTLDEFIDRLNEHNLGGGRLQLRNKTTITGGYDRCYCSMVRHASTPFKDKTYCQCSTGWYKQLFETALGRPVEVTLLQSIISGSETCEFEIKLKE
jgi:predicted hydrocarbon binding protein